MRVLAVSGSLRQDSYNTALLRSAAELAPDGVELEVHEAPRMSQESSDTLGPGNVVTVEPGIYLEGVGGIRIEDDVVVRNGGIENLTNLRKDLIEVG